MIKCVIIDDEKLARDSLELLLTRYFPEKIKVLAKSGSLKEGVFAIYKHHPEIVFLDIEMPEENGFQIFNYFQKVSFSVVFTTAYKEYSIKAIKVAALDYILKPVSVDDLKVAIELYKKRQLSDIPLENIEKLINNLKLETFKVEKVALPTSRGFQLKKINSIIYCEADQNYTRVYTIEGEKVLVSKPIKEVQKLLPDNIFFRIHKSHLVNLNYIKTYSRIDGFQVELENGYKLDVATRRKDDFIRALTHR